MSSNVNRRILEGVELARVSSRRSLRVDPRCSSARQLGVKTADVCRRALQDMGCKKRSSFAKGSRSSQGLHQARELRLEYCAKRRTNCHVVQSCLKTCEVSDQHV
eukprot:1919904-Rhodomonas_salina.1